MNPSFEPRREELQEDMEKLMEKYGITDYLLSVVRVDEEAEPTLQGALLMAGEDWPVCLNQLRAVVYPLAKRHLESNPKYAELQAVRDLSVSERRAKRTMGGD